MIDLYAAGTSNGIRARIAMEECGLSYKLHVVDLAKGENKTPAFLAMNPVGQIPVMIDPEGPGGKPLTLAQSTAILMYAAEKSGKYMPKDPAARPAFLQALMSASTDVSPWIGAVFGVIRSKDPHAPTAEFLKARLSAYFKAWDGELGKHKYAAGNEVTIADFSLYAGYVRAMGVIPETCAGMPTLARWGSEMAARPAIVRATKF